MEDNQERAGHGNEEEESLCEITNSLFHYMVSDSNEAALCFLIRNLAGHTEGVCVERCLWDQAIGERNTQKPSDTGGQSEEKDVPVKSWWFAKGELGALSDEGRD